MLTMLRRLFAASALVAVSAAGAFAQQATTLAFADDPSYLWAGVTFQLDTSSDGIVPCVNPTPTAAGERTCQATFSRAVSQPVRLRSVAPACDADDTGPLPRFSPCPSDWSGFIEAPAVAAGSPPGSYTIRGFGALPTQRTSMATIGRTTDGAFPRAVQGGCKAIRVTMPEAGAAGVSVWARVEDTGGAGESWAAFIMDGANNGTILATSAIRADVSTLGWKQFSGGGLASFAPANGASYLLCIGTLSSAGSSVYNDDAGATYDPFVSATVITSLTPVTFSGTAVLDPDNALRDYSIYLEYTPAGGGAIAAIVGHYRNQGMQ